MDRDSITTPAKTWWTPVWRGLVVDPEGKHLHRMKNALGLYLYLLSHADRRSGRLVRKYETIARDMGFPVRTIRDWMQRLYFYEYVQITKTGRAMIIDVLKWRPVGQERAPLLGTSLPLRVAETGHGEQAEPPRSQERRGLNGQGPIANESTLTRIIKRKNVVRIFSLANSDAGSADDERRRRAELLVQDLASSLGDPAHLSRYRRHAQRFPESLLRRLLSEARAMPEREIKRSKAALFEYLLQQHVLSSAPAEPHDSRN